MAAFLGMTGYYGPDKRFERNKTFASSQMPFYPVMERIGMENTDCPVNSGGVHVPVITVFQGYTSPKMDM
jgi:hypothetical protein